MALKAEVNASNRVPIAASRGKEDGRGNQDKDGEHHRANRLSMALRDIAHCVHPDARLEDVEHRVRTRRGVRWRSPTLKVRQQAKNRGEDGVRRRRRIQTGFGNRRYGPWIDSNRIGHLNAGPVAAHQGSLARPRP